MCRRIQAGSNFMRYFVFTALLLLAAGSTFAETRYVSDHLVITMRTGQGNSYKVLRQLHSGTPLHVLEEDGEFIRVRTERGTEGWVRGQYLVNEPVAKDRLAAAEEKLARLDSEARSLRQQVSSLKSERDSFKRELNGTESDKISLEKQVAELKKVAAMPLRLREENQVMKDRIDTLELELTQIERVNDELRNNSQRDWFITGAGVLGSGIFLGLVLPFIRRKRRSSGWSDLH